MSDFFIYVSFCQFKSSIKLNSKFDSDVTTRSVRLTRTRDEAVGPNRTFYHKHRRVVTESSDKFCDIKIHKQRNKPWTLWAGLSPVQNQDRIKPAVSEHSESECSVTDPVKPGRSLRWTSERLVCTLKQNLTHTTLITL